MARLAFFGLGNMGAPMAHNLAKAGHDVKAFDISEAARNRFVQDGGAVAETIADALAGAECVISMLPAGEHVHALYMPPDGLLSSLSGDCVCIDCSTIDVATSRAVEQVAHEAGILMVDAPVSGGVAGAEAAMLTFMVGGRAAAWAASKPYLLPMGKAVIHAGGPGTGQAAKICNNLVLGVSMIAVSEAFNLAEKLDLDADRLFEIAAKSSGQCWSLTSYCPAPGMVSTSPANSAYKPGFAAEMMLKDLKLAQASANEVGAITPLGAEAAQLFGLFVASGGAGVDFSGIIRFLKGEGS